MASSGAFVALASGLAFLVLFWLLRRNEASYWRSARARRRARNARPAKVRPAPGPRAPAAAAAPQRGHPAPPRRTRPAEPPPLPTGTFAAGAEGEARVAAVIAAAGLPSVSGIYLPNENGYSQIDHVALAGAHVLVVETKNLAGTLSGAGTAREWTQRLPGKPDRSFYSPVLQVARHLRTLSALDPAPLVGWVALAGRARPPAGAAPGVVHVADLPDRLRELARRPGDAGKALEAWETILRHVAETPQAQARAAHDIDHERRAGWARRRRLVRPG